MTISIANLKALTDANYHIKGRFGDKVEIHCKVDTSSVVSFIWLKNHYVIHENISNFNDASTLTLELSSADDFGNYTCSAYNQIGELKQVYEVVENEFSELETPAEISSSGSFHIQSVLFIILCSCWRGAVV